jgi:hypothetical protein
MPAPLPFACKNGKKKGSGAFFGESIICMKIKGFFRTSDQKNIPDFSSG